MSEQPTSTKPSFGATQQTPVEPAPKTEKKKEEIAVVWKRKDKNNDEYISVKIKAKPEDIKNGEINFKAFKNKIKGEGDNKPDFIGYRDEPKKEEKKD